MYDSTKHGDIFDSIVIVTDEKQTNRKKKISELIRFPTKNQQGIDKIDQKWDHQISIVSRASRWKVELFHKAKGEHVKRPNAKKEIWTNHLTQYLNKSSLTEDENILPSWSASSRFSLLSFFLSFQALRKAFL